MSSSRLFHHDSIGTLILGKKNLEKKTHSVVAWDGNVDVSQWVVGCDETNDWHVDIRSLSDWLMVSNWVGDDDQTWLLESNLDLIGE